MKSAPTKWSRRSVETTPGKLWPPLLFLAVILPGHLGGGAGDWLFTGVAVAAALIGLRRPWPSVTYGTLRTRPVIALFLAVTFLYTFAYYRSLMLGEGVTGLRDYVELARYPMQCVLFLGTGHAVRAATVPAIRRALALAIWASVALSLLYAADVPWFSDVLRTSVYEGVKTTVLGAEKLRISIPFENPNHLGFFAVLACGYLLLFPGRHRLAAMGAAGIVLATGSRTAWAGLLVVATAWVTQGLIARYRRQPVRPLHLVTLVLIVAVVATGTPTSLVVEFVESGRVERTWLAYTTDGLAQDPNAQVRVAQAREIAEQAVHRPLLGYGALKYERYDSIDSQYTAWLHRNGLLGLMLILLLYGSLLRIQCHRASMEDRVAGLTKGKMAIGALWASVMVMLAGGAFLNNFRLLIIFYIIVAAAGSSSGRARAAQRIPAQDIALLDSRGST